jgi:hypothetical protein
MFMNLSGKIPLGRRISRTSRTRARSELYTVMLRSVWSSCVVLACVPAAWAGAGGATGSASRRENSGAPSSTAASAPAASTRSEGLVLSSRFLISIPPVKSFLMVRTGQAGFLARLWKCQRNRGLRLLLLGPGAAAVRGRKAA